MSHTKITLHYNDLNLKNENNVSFYRPDEKNNQIMTSSTASATKWIIGKVNGYYFLKIRNHRINTELFTGAPINSVTVIISRFSNST